MTPPIGLWLDDSPGVALASLDEIAELGISTVAIMLESPRPSWDPMWSLDQVARACERARGLDLEVVLTAWPSPRRAYLEAMHAWLERACSLGVVGVEVDLEGQWKRDDCDGTLSLPQAASLLLMRLRALAGAHDLRIEVTTHPGHQESSPSALVAPHVDRLVAQAYSIRRRPGGELVAWDDPRMGPGHHQRWAAADARTAIGYGHVDLSLGLALWSQSWPGHSPGDALTLAWRASLAEQPAEIRFWSSKWLVGGHATPYGRSWLRSLDL